MLMHKGYSRCMAELFRNESFAEYGTLLDERLDLQVAMQTADEGDVVALREKIEAIDQEIARFVASPDLPQSALRCGAMLSERVTDGAIDTEIRQAYQYRLRQVAAFVIERSLAQPELADDPCFAEVQIAMGSLAVDEALGLPPTAEAGNPDVAPARALPVDYHMALQRLQNRLDTFAPGEHYKLTAAQVVTLADPTMGFSPWQRNSFVRLARKVLSDEGYLCTYNNGRGRSALYTIGRPDPH